MKKIFLGLFACIFFLFSCNLEASFGGTDLVIPLPGSEAKIAKYDAGDVASYRVDITRNDGVHYSETGSAGGVIVFENILCGTYTVDIYALDGDTYVAARGSASIEIIKNEENYLSAEAVLQNKVSDFFVSVPKGVWNLDHARYFRGENYYNAVRDVEYGAYETETDGGNFITVTTAEIVNPDVEYAYLNYISDEIIGSELACGFKCKFKAEKKTRFWISIYDSLREDYGVTKYYEYDPESDAVLSAAQDGFLNLDYFWVNKRPYMWKALVKIGFPKDCGKVTVASPFITQKETSDSKYNITSNTSMLPQENASVVVEDLPEENIKFIFDKSKSGGKYTAALFTGMQFRSYDYLVVTVEGLKVNKPVRNFNIAVKSFATKKKLFESKLTGYELQKYNASYGFKLVVPPIFVYEPENSSDYYEGAYLEISPEGWDGNELIMEVGSVSYDKFNNGYSKAADNFLIGYRDLKDMGVDNVIVQLDFDGEYTDVLTPRESKTFVASCYPYVDSHYKSYCTEVKPGKLYPYQEDDTHISIPFNLIDIKNDNVPELTCSKLSDGKFSIKNNSDCDLQITFHFDDPATLRITKNSGYQSSYGYDYRTSSDVIVSGDKKMVKLATIDAKYFTNDDSFIKINLLNISCIPVLGKVSDNVVMGKNQSEVHPSFYVVAKSKSGEIFDYGTYEGDAIESETVTYNDYYYLNGRNKISIKNTVNPRLVKYDFAKEDTVVEIYLCYDKRVSQNMLSVYDFCVNLQTATN